MARCSIIVCPSVPINLLSCLRRRALRRPPPPRRSHSGVIPKSIIQALDCDNNKFTRILESEPQSHHRPNRIIIPLQKRKNKTMAQIFMDLFSSFGSCLNCFPGSPTLKINSRSFKILRLLGEVTHSSSFPPPSLPPRIPLSFELLGQPLLLNTKIPHYYSRAVSPTSTWSKTHPPLSFSPSKRSDARSGRNP